MSGIEIAAIIGAATTLTLGLLGLLGASVRYVIKMILDAYKQQVVSTETAKNSEIKALEARVDRQEETIAFQRETILRTTNGGPV